MIFTEFFSLLFYKLETIKLNPKIIRHTFRFSAKIKENPQAIILSADTAVGRFKTNKQTKNPLYCWINSKQATHILEKEMKTMIHALGIKYTDN